MTPAELAQLLKDNPDIAIVPERGCAPTPAQLAMQRAAIAAAQAKLPEPHEDEMQAAVVAWANSQDHPALKWLFHVPNGEYRHKATAGKLTAMGISRGVPDLLLPWHSSGVGYQNFIGLAIEMKRKPNHPTAEQLAWLDHLTQQGWRCEVCYSAQAAIDVLCEYLDIA